MENEQRKSTQKISNWWRNKGATKAASQLNCYISDVPPPGFPVN